MRLRLSDISDADAQKWFRFDKGDITRLQHALQVPDHVVTRNRDHANGDEAFCILLPCFLYPNRLFDDCKLMHRSLASLSQIFNHILSLLQKIIAICPQVNLQEGQAESEVGEGEQIFRRDPQNSLLHLCLCLLRGTNLQKFLKHFLQPH